MRKLLLILFFVLTACQSTKDDSKIVYDADISYNTKGVATLKERLREPPSESFELKLQQDEDVFTDSMFGYEDDISSLALYQDAVRHFKSRQYQKSLLSLEKAIQTIKGEAPYSPEQLMSLKVYRKAFFLIALNKIFLGQDESGVMMLKKLAFIHPEWERVYQVLSYYYLAEGNEAFAASVMKRFFERYEQRSPLSYEILALAYQKQKNMKQAFIAVNEGLKHYADNEILFCQKARLLFKTGEAIDACNVISSGIAGKKSLRPETISLQGTCLIKKDLLDDAFLILKGGIEEYPHYPYFYFQIGIIAQKEGKTAEVVENWQKFSSLVADDSIKKELIQLEIIDFLRENQLRLQ